jgi:hypothetical protein
MRSCTGRVRTLASVTMIVHEVEVSPVSGFFHRSHRPGEAQHTAVPRADEVWLFAVRHLEPLVVATRGQNAPMPLECIPEHRLVDNAFGSRVEACRQLLERLFPPPWNEPASNSCTERGARENSWILSVRATALRSDATVKKVSSQASPQGELGQTYLVSGKRVSMRLWRSEEP